MGGNGNGELQHLLIHEGTRRGAKKGNGEIPNLLIDGGKRWGREEGSAFAVREGDGVREWCEFVSVYERLQVFVSVA